MAHTHVLDLQAAASVGVWLRAIETEIGATLWALVAWEGLSLSIIEHYRVHYKNKKYL